MGGPTRTIPKKSLGPTEETGARIDTPPPTPPPTPRGRNREQRGDQSENDNESETSEESGEESAEEDEGRIRTTLQARIKKNGEINLGYARKIEGAERTEDTKIKMAAIRTGPLGVPTDQHEEGDTSEKRGPRRNIKMERSSARPITEHLPRTQATHTQRSNQKQKT